MMTKLLL